jgi:hypothetical protein
MDLWVALGIFLVGAGVGALTTVALYVNQIHQLKDLLKATHTRIPEQKNKCHKSGQAQVRLASEVSRHARTNPIHQPSEESGSLG